jgi:probable DNA metabolism protein
MIASCYLYDGTFDGLLTVVFEIYEFKRPPNRICSGATYSPGMFEEVHNTITSPAKADRVAKKIKQIGQRLFKKLFKVYLSERPDREMLVYHIIELALKDRGAAFNDYRNPSVLKVKEIVKQINREVHRMHAFVRFQELADGIWFAAIEPDFDVLPLTGSHFKKRYADQPWVIYDAKRKYGIHYDLTKINFVDVPHLYNKDLSRLKEDFISTKEKDYQKLWKDYFEAVNIKERKNLKLHIKHVPKRYWKYLFEK